MYTDIGTKNESHLPFTTVIKFLIYIIQKDFISFKD